MENHLIACFATDSQGTVFVETLEGDYIVETVDTDGDCLYYVRTSDLQAAWAAFDSQRGE